jgi:beta-lactamase class A
LRTHGPGRTGGDDSAFNQEHENMNRRDWLGNTLAGALALVLTPVSVFARGAETDGRLAALERRHGGRLGVAILDTGSGRRLLHRADERFLMCSTFKLLLVANVLKQVEAGKEHLDRRVVFGRDVLLEYAPVTRDHAGKNGMNVEELCAAAITLSDNTAANLLLKAVGGPAAVTAHARTLGDAVTRLDRMEPELNRPDGDLDTTTPQAMLGDLQALILGDALSQPSREKLTNWLIACKTGLQSVRAGLPGDCRAGDKTGTGRHASNDVVVAWPSGRKPVLISAYYTHDSLDADGRRAVLAEVGDIVAAL